MKRKTMAPQLPVAVYDQLQSLAEEEGVDPADRVAQLVAAAGQRRTWRHNPVALREQIPLDGGLHVGATKDEVVRRSRRTLREIFAAECAHPY